MPRITLAYDRKVNGRNYHAGKSVNVDMDTARNLIYLGLARMADEAERPTANVANPKAEESTVKEND